MFSFSFSFDWWGSVRLRFRPDRCGCEILSRKRFSFYFTKKVDLFVGALKYHELLARIEQKHATTITTNEQHKVVPRVHSYSSFTLPHSLYLFAFVSVYLILISVVTVVELTRSVVRLSEFVYAVIA